MKKKPKTLDKRFTDTPTVELPEGVDIDPDADLDWQTKTFARVLAHVLDSVDIERIVEKCRNPLQPGVCPENKPDEPKQQRPSQGEASERDEQQVDTALDNGLKDLPEPVKKGLIGRVVNAVQVIAARIKLPSLAEDLLDTFYDESRIYYASGKSMPNPIEANFGIPLSPGQATVLASAVAAKLYLFLRKKITGRSMKSEPDRKPDIDTLLKLFGEIHKEFPELGKPPTREDLAQPKPVE